MQQTHRGHASPPAPRSGPLLPPGFRWIAVRPGGPPPQRRRRRPLGPTPRYSSIPNWGLVDPATVTAPAPEPTERDGPSLKAVRATIFGAVALLAFAVLAHIARYVLLIINRNVLLNPVVAVLATWVPVVASVGVIFAIVGMALVVTEWLIARRARAFAHHGQPEPRRLWALRVGCLVPLVNLFWTLVYVIELAVAEDRYPQVRRLLWTWWSFFILSTAVSIYASATSFPHNTQGIADNTLAFIVAYLMAMAAVIMTARLLFAFERRPVERPARRWLIVTEESNRRDEPAKERPKSAAAVERDGEEPAA
jgi:hypothetical protein